MHRILNFEIISHYLIKIHFEDGYERTIDFRPFIKSGLSRELEDVSFFHKVAIDSGGGLFWPNEFDFCPNFLHDYVPESLKPEKVLA